MYGIFEIGTNGGLVWMRNTDTLGAAQAEISEMRAAYAPSEVMGFIVIKMEFFIQTDI